MVDFRSLLDRGSRRGRYLVLLWMLAAGLAELGCPSATHGDPRIFSVFGTAGAGLRFAGMTTRAVSAAGLGAVLAPQGAQPLSGGRHTSVGLDALHLPIVLGRRGVVAPPALLTTPDAFWMRAWSAAERHVEALAHRHLTQHFSLLTYNVAGLPALVSPSQPDLNIPQIGALLDNYDLVVVQEDFSYHEQLSAAARHPYRSTPVPAAQRVMLGDGLSSFSRLPFESLTRHAWTRCNGHLSDGNDCLTVKGFSVAEHHLDADHVVDVYNFHMDSGGGPGDVEARSAQVDQLLAHLRERSRGKAVIVAGDTNLEFSEPALYRLLLGADLRDACRAVACDSPERIDRVLFRSGGGVDLDVEEVAVDGRFVRDDGAPLSDHQAVAALFAWKVR